MLLTRLKYWRELRGYSLRELADRSKIPYSAISLLENLKREPQGRTSRKLAAARCVEVTDLNQPDPVVLEPKYTPAQSDSDNKTITASKSTRAKKQLPPGSSWVLDQDGDAFGPSVLEEADKLKSKLGGQHQTRVYQAASKNEAREQHRQFLIKVARGHDAW